MINRTEKPKFPLKFAKRTVRYKERPQNSVMALIKREILTSHKVLYMKSCTCNNTCQFSNDSFPLE